MRPFSIVLFAFIIIFSSCEKDDGLEADYEVPVNGTFQLVLDSNPSTGYHWEWANKEFVSIVDTIDRFYVANPQGGVGGGGQDTWVFKGLGKGIDVIYMKYRQSWNSGAAADSMRIIVHVK